MATERDELVTPAGRLFLQPEINQVVSCVLGSKRPIDVDAIRSLTSNSVLMKHPRFSSLLVTDRHGREHWKKIQVNVDDHIIVHHDPLSVNDTDAVNDYVADISVSTPLSRDKPLWEIHVLEAHKCAVLRVHHALGDGISLMSLLLSLCGRRTIRRKYR